MMNINRVILVGKVIRDPLIITTAKGLTITKFIVMTRKKWRTYSGETRKEYQFIPVTTWPPLSNVCKETIKRGVMVLVEGYLKISPYEKDGEKRVYTEVVASTAFKLSNNRSIDEDDGPKEEIEAKGKAMEEKISETAEVDDIPF